MRVTHIKTREHTVYIGRTGGGLMHAANSNGFGNPHPVGYCTICRKTHARGEALEAFRQWLHSGAPEAKACLLRIKALPRDAVLGCFCHPQACHGDVIAEAWRTLSQGDPQ